LKKGKGKGGFYSLAQEKPVELRMKRCPKCKKQTLVLENEKETLCINDECRYAPGESREAE